MRFETHNMEYNSEKPLLIIPEYGRNVQMLVKHATTIENDEERQAFVEQIVDLIQQMHPQNRNIEDYKEKLWKHIFRIAEYNIEVIPPGGEHPRPEDYKKKPNKIKYPSIDTRFRHYGHNVQVLIQKALEMEPGPIKDGFVTVIGSYMKLAYRTWNKEHYVSDEIIRTDLEVLSNGQLTLVENTSIDNLANANRRRKRTNDRYDRNDRDRNDRDRNSRYSNGRNNGRGGRNNNRNNNGNGRRNHYKK